MLWCLGQHQCSVLKAADPYITPHKGFMQCLSPEICRKGTAKETLGNTEVWNRGTCETYAVISV